MEISIKKDIRNILEILQSPTGISRTKSIEAFDKHGEPQHATSQQPHHSQLKDELTQVMAMQPSESEFSFELCMDTKRQTTTQTAQQQQSSSTHSQRMQTAGTSQVHRSISQPECTNTSAEKNLLRYFARSK